MTDASSLVGTVTHAQQRRENDKITFFSPPHSYIPQMPRVTRVGPGSPDSRQWQGGCGQGPKLLSPYLSPSPFVSGRPSLLGVEGESQGERSSARVTPCPPAPGGLGCTSPCSWPPVTMYSSILFIAAM